MLTTGAKQRKFEFIKPITRLNDSQLAEVKQAVWKRDDLRDYIREELSNEALAAKFGVNVCTVERAIRYSDRESF